MQTQKTLSELFQNEPAHWGFRGDPFLWKEMKAKLGDHEYPETEEQLSILLEQTYQQLTGASLSSREPIFVERHSHGGMSSGDISPEFWAEQAIPLLLQRYRESK